MNYPVALAVDKDRLFESVGYRPHEGQREFHRARERFRLLCAGSRFGKSYAAAMEALAYLLTPGTQSWIVAPTYDLGEKEFRYVLDKARGLGVPLRRVNDNVHSGDMMIETEAGSWLKVRSWSMNPANLLGEELDLMVLSEGAQMRRPVWERYLRARLSSRKGRLVIPTTPAGIDDFLHPLFYEPALRGEPDYWMGEYPSYNNPMIDDAEVAQLRKSMDADTFAEQVEGKFVHFAGKVFKDFDRNVHVVSGSRLPPRWREWPKYRSLDPGFADPFAIIWLTVGPDGTIYLYRESYARRQILSWHVKLMKDFEKGPPEERIALTVIDPSAKAARVDTGIPLTTQLAEMGIYCTLGYNRDRQTRVWRIQEYLRCDIVTGLPKLFILDTCPNAIAEFENFCYVEQPLDGRNIKDKLPEKNDHVLDALGGWIMTRPARAFEADTVDPRSFRHYREIVNASRKKSDVIGADDSAVEQPAW